MPRSSATRQALLLIILIPLAAYASSTLSVFRDGLQDYYRIDLQQLGLLLGIGFIPSAVASAFAGLLVRRWGSRRVLLAAMLGVAAGGALAAVAFRLPFMFLAIALWTASYAAMRNATEPYLTQLYPHARRRVLTTYMLSLSAGGIVFPVIIEWLLVLQAKSPSIRFAHVLHGPFAVIAAAMILGVVLLRRTSSANDTPQADGVGVPMRSMLRISSGSILLILAMVALGTADSAVTMWMPRVLVSAGLPPLPWGLKPGYVMALWLAANLLARTGLAAAHEHFARRRLMVWPGLIGAASLLVGLLVRQPLAIAAALILNGFIISVQMPTLLAELSHREGPGFAWTVSLKSIVGNLAAFAMVTTMGWLGKKLGDLNMWAVLLIPTASYAAASAFAWVWQRRYDNLPETGANREP